MLRGRGVSNHTKGEAKTLIFTSNLDHIKYHG